MPCTPMYGNCAPPIRRLEDNDRYMARLPTRTRQQCLQRWLPASLTPGLPNAVNICSAWDGGASRSLLVPPPTVRVLRCADTPGQTRNAPVSLTMYGALVSTAIAWRALHTCVDTHVLAYSPGPAPNGGGAGGPYGACTSGHDVAY